MSTENLSDYTYVAFKDKDNLTKLKSKTGTVVVDTVLGPMLTSGLAAMSGNASNFSGGKIKIAAGEFNLGSNFIGWDLPKWVEIEMNEGTILNVPGGYSGFVFRIGAWSGQSSATTNIAIHGGYLRELGPQGNNWVGIVFDVLGAGQGTHSCHVFDTHIINAKTGIEFRNSAPNGWINGCNIYNVGLIGCINGMEWINTATSGAAPFNRNLCVGVIGQSDAKTAYGFKNIGPGVANTFVECKMWDIDLGSGGNAVTSNIVSGARYTKIIGGIMTSQNFDDQGQFTSFDDDISGMVLGQDVLIKNRLTVSGNVNLYNGLQASGDLTMLGANINMFGNTPALRTSGNAPLLIRNNSSGGTISMYLNPGAGSGANVNSSISLWSASAQVRRFFLQQDYTNSIINSLRQTTDGTAPTMQFKLQDVPNVTTLEPMRFDASGHVIFNTSGANAGAGVKFRGHIAFESGASGISFSGMQYLPARGTADYIIWTSGQSLFQAFNTKTGLIEFSGASGQAHVVIQAAWDKVAAGSVGGNVHIKAGFFPLISAVVLSGSTCSILEGEGVERAQLRSMSGDACIKMDFCALTAVRDLWLTHNSTTQSGGLLVLKGGHNTVQNVEFYDFGKYVSGTYAIMLDGESGSCYRNDFNNCYIDGLDNAIYANVMSGYFVNNNNFMNVHSVNSRRLLYVKSQIGAAFDANQFLQCEFQTASGSKDGFDYETEHSGHSFYTSHVNTITWDLTSGYNYARINAFTELNLYGCIPSYKISGNGTLLATRKFRRYDQSARNEGQFLGSGLSGVTTTYAFPHGLVIAPTFVSVTPASMQATSGVMVASGGATNITVTFTAPPASGDVRINWSAQA